MKKSLIVMLALIFVLGIAGTAFAASIFEDVPAKHWSYDAVNKLAKAGIVEGYGDGTFRGEHTLSRYEMAIIAGRALTKMEKADAENKALIEKLVAEYSSELKKLDDKFTDKYNTLDKRVDNVILSGYVRAKYDSDTSDGRNINGGNKHFYMNLEGQMKVSDRWDAHFQSETNKEYTNSTWLKSDGSGLDTTGYNSGNDGTIQRMWVVGTVGKVGVTAGTKWWGYASNVLFGHAANGIQLDYPVTPDFTASVFTLRPTQGSLVSASFANAPNTSLYGLQLNGNLSKTVNATLVVGGNHTTGDLVDSDPKKDTVYDTGVTRWGAIDVSAKLGDDFKVTGTYAKTNADEYNKSYEFRVDYKAVDLKKPGSYDIYLRYVNFQKYGDISHDDEWSSLPGDMKGWVIGYDYALTNNVQWTTLYSDQTINISGTAKSLNNASRKLIRTQVDFHF